MEKALLQRLAIQKLADAQALLDARRSTNAYYLAGYAVEFALKVVIADVFRTGVIPDRKFVSEIHTHDIARLLALSGMKSELEAAVAGSARFAGNWSTAQRWNEHARYAEWSYDDATNLIAAIDDPHEGVLAWIARRW